MDRKLQDVVFKILPRKLVCQNKLVCISEWVMVAFTEIGNPGGMIYIQGQEWKVSIFEILNQRIFNIFISKCQQCGGN